ncbi:AimR family lysis-lysogeny pheromone receptor [Shouchella rhizosphaerae]|uniref:AimR family lysis-lysogeny pheromone receptor n=1 Tax=Shouchella rhizosphaerae TaxID=866786 RepID=A0ABZ2CW25_9BACI
MAWISEENKALLAKEGMKRGQTLTYDSVIQLTKKYPSLEFEDILTIVKYVDEDHFKPLMISYCKDAKKLQEVYSSFEFAFVYKDLALIDYLINRHQNDVLLTHCCKVYSLGKRLLENNISAENLLISTQSLLATNEHDATYIKLKLLEFTAFLRMKQLQTAFYLLQKLEITISQLDNRYLKTVFAARFSCNLALGYLNTHADFEKAELYALSTVVNPTSENILLGAAYRILGQIYLYQKNKFDQSYEHFQLAISIYEEINAHDQIDSILYQDIVFLHNLHNKYIDLNEKVDLEEQAHQHIVRGNRKRALELLNLQESKYGASKYSFFYRAKATNNISFYMNALKIAAKEGEIPVCYWMFEEFDKLILTTLN